MNTIESPKADGDLALEEAPGAFLGNVRTPSGTAIAGPLIRRLTDCYVIPNRFKDGHDWLLWKWEPEPRDDGRPDCGYSAVRDDHEDFEAAFELFFMV